MISRPDHAKAKAALFLALMANVASQIFLMTILPPLGRRLGFTDLQSGAILSVSALILIVSAPIWGYVSERAGRRPVLLIALAGSVLGPALYGLIVGARLEGTLGAMAALALLFAARAAQSSVTGGLQPTSQAYVADITPAGERMVGMGLIGAAYGLGAIAGAGFVWWLGDRPALAFGLIAGLVGLSWVNMFLSLAEPPRVAEPRSAEAPLVLSRIWPCLVVTMVGFAAYGIVQQVVGLRLTDSLGFTVDEAITGAGAVLVVTAFAMVVMQGLILRIVTLRAERLVPIGAALAAAAMFLCSLAQSYEQILAISLVFGLALGLILPGNLAVLSLCSDAGAQGKTAGVNMIAQGLGLALGPIVGAGLHQISPQVPYVAAGVLLAGAAGLTMAVWRPKAGMAAETAR